MPVNVQWDSPEQKIMHYGFTGNWSWGEFYEALEKAQNLQRPVPHTVDVLLDFRSAGLVPLGAVSQFRRVAMISTPNTGIRVVITQNHFVMTLFNLFMRVYPAMTQRYRFAISIEEAYQIIESVSKERAAGG